MSNHLECFYCGAQNRGTTHFCRQCGRSLADLPAQAPAQAAVPANQLTAADTTAVGSAPAATDNGAAPAAAVIAGAPPTEISVPRPATEVSVPPPGRPSSDYPSTMDIGRPAYPAPAPVPAPAPLPPGPTSPPGSSQPPSRPHRAWWPVPLILAVVLGAAALAGWQTRWPTVIFGVQNAARDTPARPGAGGAVPSGAPASGGASTAPGGSARQQAANSLAGLLSQSMTDRSSVNEAFNDVMDCGPNLSQDAQTFQNAEQARQQLITQLASLPSQSALPSPMLPDLSRAWQESAQVDSDYAQWAQDQAGGCTPDSTTDPSYVAAEDPNRQATADKTAFAGQWNGLAKQYGLTQYSQSYL